MSLIGGKLKFKGGGAPNKKSEREKDLALARIKAQREYEELPPELSSDQPAEKEKKIKEIKYDPQDGTGRILTSGTTVHGKDTKFMKEIKAGDTLIIRNPSTLNREERTVIVVLSDRSLSINSAFSTDLSTYTDYEFQKKTEY
mmetsp:Transcript_29910/g.27382  ORF Transcript_29910/g.27382 Transcript_29910/m.27382 type:complete len:143 (-) Transcript_29910:290-718(-)